MSDERPYRPTHEAVSVALLELGLAEALLEDRQYVLGTAMLKRARMSLAPESFTALLARGMMASMDAATERWQNLAWRVTSPETK